jgi:hypothetical protein
MSWLLQSVPGKSHANGTGVSSDSLNPMSFAEDDSTAKLKPAIGHRA